MLRPEQFPLRVRAVVFDLDGTLLDTIADLAHAANLMREELGLASISEELIKTYVGKGISNLVRRTLAVDAGRDPNAERHAQGLAIYERHYAQVMRRQTTHYPGVFEGLTAMRAAGFRLGCVTNKAARFSEPLLRDMGIAPFMELILSGDSLPKKKPDPLPLQHACEHFRIAPSELVLIGDSINDSEAARAAGCYFFLVPYGYHQRPNAAEIDADAIVDGLVQAAALIEKSVS
jgi:phosphoglycolate phosphatase